MDSSTVIFIATLIIAFIFLRWLIAPIPPTLPNELNQLNQARRNSPDTTTSANSNSTSRHRREVTDSMIEVVQAIAPQLTVGQIRLDLQRTGSVELTIDRYMELGNLPYPPGESAQEVQEEEHNHNVKVNKEPENLLTKYGLSNKINDVTVVDESSINENKWSSSKQERATLLSKRREEMILKARKRLASQLQNEVGL